VSFAVRVCTLFPEFFSSAFQTSILGRAIEESIVDVTLFDIRDFANNRHKSVDDSPYGGGAGMVMQAAPVCAAVRAARRSAPGVPVIHLSPQGATFTQRHAEWLAGLPGAIFLCGRYEGIDERAIDRCVDVELSLGDFVLTGGEPAAAVMIDAAVRLLPGVLGNSESATEESFSGPRLEHPQFTRPLLFDGVEVPSVLRSGDHGGIARWRSDMSERRTAARRPDLLEGVSPGMESSARDDEWLWKRRHPDLAVDET
jgi:tRNA (guanine37-N1)-methyltransferase